MPHYLARWTSPVAVKNGQTEYEDGRPVKWNDIIAWPQHGTIQAKDAEQALHKAKAQFGGSPVIEEIQEPIHYV